MFMCIQYMHTSEFPRDGAKYFQNTYPIAKTIVLMRIYHKKGTYSPFSTRGCEAVKVFQDKIKNQSQKEECMIL